jgi:hypothetical protein
MLFAMHPKLAKDYFLSVFGDLPIMAPDNEAAALATRELTLNVYRVFRDARARSMTQFIPASDVIFDAVAEGALMCQKASVLLGVKEASPKPRDEARESRGSIQ